METTTTAAPEPAVPVVLRARTGSPKALIVDALDMAVMNTVHNFRDSRRRGAAALGPRIGMVPGTLANKANPDFQHQQLTLREALQVMAVTHNYSILQALCLLMDHVAHPHPDFSACSDAALLDLWATYLTRQGEHAATVRLALADGVVTRAELQQVREAMQICMAAGLEFIGRMEGLCREH